MTGSEDRRPTPQEDLMALLSNPDALRMLAFGARTMGRFVETGREISKVLTVVPGAGSQTQSASAPTGESDEPVEQPATHSVPEGSLLVPIEAWNRVLGQIGNLHEAGQALAVARERAARAEAVAEFQAERRKIAEAEAERLEAELEARDAAPPRSARPGASRDSSHSRSTFTSAITNWLRS